MDRLHPKEHYNARPEKNVDERKDSPIFRLRVFNNWIKAVLIQRALSRIQDREVNVLDMACGKGGDLSKYKRARNVKRYVGLDIADISVDHARQRFSQGRMHFSADFYSGDAFGKPLPDDVKNDSFQLVSCQFALHYAFKEEKIARQAIDNVSRALSKGGVFICTIPNSRVLLARAKSGKFNEQYRLDFVPDAPSSKYGHEYTFWLSDAIDSCPEYLVDHDLFISLCLEHGLHLQEYKAFQDAYTQYGPEYHDLLRYMGVVDGSDRLQMTNDEMAIAELYSAYLFIKK